MKTIFLFVLFITFCNVSAQPPPGYYDNAQGLTGLQLKQELHDIIDGHNAQSYSSIWSHFNSTDKKQNGKVWDMYSDNPGGTPPYQYNFSTDQCGNYSQEGDCYNREHSWPKSWFNDNNPMNTDLFHIYPTDGYVNGRRGNYPFGEVNNPNWTSLNGSKVGNCSCSGYTGVVFEPVDEYKGDFARTYFYFSVRYYNEDAGWAGSPMTNGAELKAWAVDMLKQWHADDTVSYKEIDRNNAVYNIQNNRNPFIDDPSWVYDIWGPLTSLTDEISEETFQVFPNPVDDVCYISYEGNEDISSWEIRVLNILGQEIGFESLDNPDVVEISTGGFLPGLYFLFLIPKEGSGESPISIKFVKLASTVSILN